MGTKPKHTYTPGPWYQSHGRICDYRLNEEIAQCTPRGGSNACAVMQANARRIVLCCNAHDALVEALEIVTLGYEADLGEDFNWERWHLKARAALRAAKVKP